MSKRLDSTDFWVLFAMIVILMLIVGVGQGVQIRSLLRRVEQLEQHQ